MEKIIKPQMLFLNSRVAAPRMMDAVLVGWLAHWVFDGVGSRSRNVRDSILAEFDAGAEVEEYISSKKD